MKDLSHSERIPSLDGLRAVSIGLVLIGHMLVSNGVEDRLSLGPLGVRTFFVISGFLITGLLLREIQKTSKIDLLRFYYRRTLRIFPPYYFYLLVILGANLIGLVSVPNSHLVLASVYLTDYVDPQYWNIGHTWSLSIEEQFYLILPGILLVLGAWRSKLALVCVIVLSPIIRVAHYDVWGDQYWVDRGFHLNMDVLATGCLLALIRPALHKNAIYLRLLNSHIVFALVPVILFLMLQTDHPHIYLGGGLTIINLGIALLVDWSITNLGSAVGRVLNSRPFTVLGVMSYSIYLWQQPFFNRGSGLSSFPLNLVGIAVMSVISYFLVERASLRLRHRWEAKLFSQKPASPSTDGLEKAGAAA